MKFYYPVIVRRLSDGSYSAHFPDLKMCEASGRTMEDVLEHATEAAWNWIDLELQEEDPDLPPATDPVDMNLENNEEVREILVNYRMTEGWEE